MHPTNQHTLKPVYIGEILKNGQFKIVYSSDGLVSPDSYSTYLMAGRKFSQANRRTQWRWFFVKRIRVKFIFRIAGSGKSIPGPVSFLRKSFMKKLLSVFLFILFIPGLLSASEARPKALSGEMGVGPEVVLLLCFLASDDEEVKIGVIRKLAKTGDQRLESF